MTTRWPYDDHTMTKRWLRDNDCWLCSRGPKLGVRSIQNSLASVLIPARNETYISSIMQMTWFLCDSLDHVLWAPVDESNELRLWCNQQFYVYNVQPYPGWGYQIFLRRPIFHHCSSWILMECKQQACSLKIWFLIVRLSLKNVNMKVNIGRADWIFTLCQ